MRRILLGDRVSINLFGTQVPTVPVYSDPAAVTLGTRFYCDVAGIVTHIRFYKGSADGGNTHTLALYNAAGALLTSQITSGEPSSGWISTPLNTPITITANTAYTVAVYWPGGRIPYTPSFFTTQYNNGILHAYANSNGGNGVYYVGSGLTFPTSSYNENFYSDVGLLV